MIRLLFVVAAAALVSVQVVRNAAVWALAERSPDTASRMWNDHPSAAISLAMTGIGKAARNRQPVAPSDLQTIYQASEKDPLRPEPFLVRGVQAQLAGEPALSLRAFLAAERRDPRSLPAHYFLAQHFFRSGNARSGLREVAALARLAPGGADAVAPYIAAYAKNPATWPQLRRIFRSNPTLASTSLGALALDAANADAVVALSEDDRSAPTAAWAPRLLASLIQARDYDRARSIWNRVSGNRTQRDELLHDARFIDTRSPPPFNWELMSSAVGLAERQPGGRLHVIFYGQQDGLLARQMLTLRPGEYRVSMTATGNTGRAGALNWSLRCDGSQIPLSALSLTAGNHRWVFTVPSGCPAQWLELSGVSGDVATQSDFTISGLQLVGGRPNG